MPDLCFSKIHLRKPVFTPFPLCFFTEVICKQARIKSILHISAFCDLILTHHAALLVSRIMIIRSPTNPWFVFFFFFQSRNHHNCQIFFFRIKNPPTIFNLASTMQVSVLKTAMRFHKGMWYSLAKDVLITLTGHLRTGYCNIARPLSHYYYK